MIDLLFKAIYATREKIWKKCSEVLDGFSTFCRMSARPMRLAFVLAFALGTATAWAGSVTQQGHHMTFTNCIWERSEHPTLGRQPKTRGDIWYVFEDYDEPL